jgi:hypothetical protein
MVCSAQHRELEARIRRTVIVAPFLLAFLGCNENSASSRAPAPPSLTDPVSEAAPVEESEPPLVTLGGQSAPWAVTAVEPGPRVYSRDLRLWVYERPDKAAPRLGYLRAGSSSPTSEAPVKGAGCAGGWYPIRPRGFVCLDRSATLDRTDRIVELYEAHPPRTDQRLPYRYGIVRKPGPIFGRLPKLAELGDVEKDFGSRFPEWLSAPGEVGAQFRQDVWEWGRTPPDPQASWDQKLTRGVPPSLTNGASLLSPTLTPRPNGVVIDHMKPRAGHAMLDTFFWEGRRYGLTSQLELVPTDRYRPLEGSTFVGVEIGRDVDFPFAYVRRIDAKYSDGARATYRDVLKLTGKKKFIGGRLHYETETGKYIADSYASELTPAKNMPGWAKKGEKWISISINKQTLVLYEGERAVFATLVSTGEAGLESPEETTATKRGIFRVHTKHVTATMSSDESGEEFELRDVPYVQYFAQGGYALHGAYWHDRFGTPKSHGCINLSPEDARRIFHWTDPQVPTGWHGALSALKGTVVFIHP